MFLIGCVAWQSNTKSSTELMCGPVAQTGRALPLQGRGPGFKSRWVHFCMFLFPVLFFVDGVLECIFFCLCSTYMCFVYGVKGMI